MDITTLTPQEHDEVYLDRLIALANAKHEHERSVYSILSIYADLVYEAREGARYGSTRRSKWVPKWYNDHRGYGAEYDTERFESLPTANALTFYEGWLRSGGKEYQREHLKFAETQDAVSLALSLVKECDDHYYKHQWNRYFLVVSSDGHIHSSKYCSTCNKGKEPTRFVLVPYLSGASVAEAVADLGAGLCSVCFPDAPSDSKEQIKISARIALVLAEEGSEAFKVAREKARIDAQKRNDERCDGSGQQTVPSDRSWLHSCPVCGYYQRQSGKVRAHRRPRFYAVQCPTYGSDKYWNGTEWAPSTKKVAFASYEEAQAVVDAHGGTKVYSE